MENIKEFYWRRHPEVESLFLHYLDMYSRENKFLSDFDTKLTQQTSSGLLDWTDHILAPDSIEMRGKLKGLGFRLPEETETPVFIHKGVLLPSVVLVGNGVDTGPGLALSVENLEDFIQANQLKVDIEGPALSPYRRALIAEQNGVSVWAVERRGTQDFNPVYPEDIYFQNYNQGSARWANLSRMEEDEEEAWKRRQDVAEELVEKLGSGVAAYIVCRCEREYWLSRNRAGREQKKRQDMLGIGWANHDHHTFRSSRTHFSKLINLFSTLGFHKRERFYAGEEAGWGAQVMEHPTAGLTLFLDVDLAPEEVDIDFSTRDLEERDTLGTVGLWCALHGDSIFGAGMHHFAARFDFEQLMDDLAKNHVRFMPPFSNFTYLKQAFSVAEIWQVGPERIRTLLQENRIESNQAEKFLVAGSVGSHIENIERKEGYKGFNRKNVSAIIRDTDPRKG